MNARPLSLLDRMICGTERALRTVCGLPSGTGRMNPANGVTAGTEPEAGSRRRSGRLMRVNLAGEVAAQALYHAQGVTARNPAVAARLQRAAAEENDHLRWCRERLAVLGTRPSLLNPLWYAGSFVIGTLAGLGGDAASLGFLEETERQVVQHLDRHLKRLPAADRASRAVLLRMREDEARHGMGARAAGGQRPPPPGRAAMRLVSRLMTGTAYWI